MSYLPGTTTVPPLSASFQDVDENPVDPDAAPTIDIADPNGALVVTAGAPTRDSLGHYSYAWAIPANAPTGIYVIYWHATIDGEDVDESESFSVGAVVVLSPPESVVCELWAQPIDIAGSYTDAEKTVALTIASDTLYAFSGRQFPGLCTDTVRPCPKRHYDAPPVIIPGFHVGNGVPIFSRLAGYSATDAGDSCSCGGLNSGYSRVELGARPVVSITQVRIDGVVIDPALYQIDEYRYLAAVPDLVTGVVTAWPHRQDIDLPATAVGTFEVVFVFGRTVPTGGKASAIALATQILKAGTSECELPAQTQQVIRQQLNVSLIDPTVMFDHGHIGIRSVDRWLGSVNPHHTNEPGRVLSPDQPRPVAHVRT